MRKSKQIICIILAALTIISAPLTSYMEAQAGELVLELSLLDQLLIMFGINAGLGEQYDYFKRQDELKGLFEAAAEGGTAELSGYGTVNFSETQSLKEWFEWSLDCQKFLLGNLSIVNPENASRYMEVGKALDEVSYKNSGTCATNALNDNISTFYDDYNGSSEALAEDIRSCFTVINGGGGFNDDNDDDEEKAARRQKFWKTFFAVAAAGMLGVGNVAVPYAALKMYGDSEFNEYDAVFGDAYFDGNYTMNADGQYVYSVNSPEIRSVPHTSPIEYVNASLYGTSSCKVVAYHSGSNYSFVFLNSSKTSLVSISLPYVDNRLGRTSGIEDSASLNFPLYPDAASALAALKSDDFSDAENIASNSYADFKSNTGTAGAVIGNPLSGYVGSLKCLADLNGIMQEVREASDTYGGTAEMLPEIARILSEAGDIAIDKPDVDDPSSSTNYSGILGKILAAINSLPYGILNAFIGKFMTADKLTQLINNLPVLFVEAFTGMIELSLQPIINAINLVPASMQTRLIELFPDSVTLGNVIIGLPDAIAQSMMKAIADAPAFKVTPTEMPDINFPEMPSPNVNVEVNPEITLDPSYSITVQNDYTGLEGIITTAVNDAATELFVPEEGPTLDKINNMKEYFKFKDDMEAIIYEFKRNIFGITPSPILKIPIGKPSSEKYNYGTGNYIIIDVSWYAKYKDFGDKIVLAFAWAFFIWRMFVGLPGIISGSVGGLQSIGDAYTVYRKNSSKD